MVILKYFSQFTVILFSGFIFWVYKNRFILLKSGTFQRIGIFFIANNNRQFYSGHLSIFHFVNNGLKISAFC